MTVRRVWAQDVLVRADMVRAKLEAIRADETLSAGTCKLADAVEQRLDAAQRAALKVSPKPNRLSNWWRGTLVDAAYQNLHVAEVLMTSIYTEAQVEAEIPEAISRVDSRLAAGDPRRIAALELDDPDLSPAERRERLGKAVQVGFEAADFEHTRLRSFRNAVVGSAVVLGIAIVAIVVYAWYNPSAIPVCFHPDGLGGAAVCATGAEPGSRDLFTIAVMGALGGLLAAIISIKNMQGTSIAYDVPTALAALKLPVGALAALGGLLLIRASFVPGLTALDSQEQVLAYAFLFGVAQQLVVGLIDKHAQELLAGAPGKGGHPQRQPDSAPRGEAHHDRPAHRDRATDHDGNGRQGGRSRTRSRGD
jgi:hypothetical protein